MKKLFSFYVDCGRQGSLDGLFIATQDEVDKAVGQEVCFGEVLGKHSDVQGTLEAHEVVVVSEDQDKVQWLEGLLGSSVSGFNPLDYIQESEEEDEEDYEDDE
jgi:hypothetical protein